MILYSSQDISVNSTVLFLTRKLIARYRRCKNIEILSQKQCNPLDMNVIINQNSTYACTHRPTRTHTDPHYALKTVLHGINEHVGPILQLIYYYR